jgi:hypothetical protein
MLEPSLHNSVLDHPCSPTGVSITWGTASLEAPRKVIANHKLRLSRATAWPSEGQAWQARKDPSHRDFPALNLTIDLKNDVNVAVMGTLLVACADLTSTTMATDLRT